MTETEGRTGYTTKILAIASIALLSIAYYANNWTAVKTLTFLTH